MKTIALALAVSLAGGGYALAGTKPSIPALDDRAVHDSLQQQMNETARRLEQHLPSPDQCMTLSKIKASVKNATFTPLNIGQFNFALGVYDAVPPRGPLPAADNAVLLHVRGKTAIIWMKAECASVTPPTGISEALATDIRMIHPTAGETSDAPDDSQDLHL